MIKPIIIHKLVQKFTKSFFCCLLGRLIVAILIAGRELYFLVLILRLFSFKFVASISVRKFTAPVFVRFR